MASSIHVEQWQGMTPESVGQVALGLDSLKYCENMRASCG